MVTQIGPIVTVLVVAGAAATAICADLGARTIREEIDAMEVLGIDPIHRLVVPRVLACALVAMLLNGLVSMVGLVGGFLFGVYLQNVSGGAYLATLTQLTGLPEVVIATVKALTFGLIAGLVGCYRGLTVRGGSKGLGTAVNETVVLCVVALYAVNVVLTTIGVQVRNGGPGMTMAQVLSGRFPRVSADLRRFGGAATRPLEEAGKLGWFAVLGGRDMGWALTRYRKEIVRLIAEVGMGTGAMAVVGGTAVIIAFVTLSSGSLVAIQGLSSLGHVGLQTLLGFVAALINVRLVAPVVSGVVLAATVGAGATAELGAMRISEEIDALEVMGVKSMAYLVSTRALAGLVVIIPLYSLGLIMSFLSPQIITTVVYGQASGTYEHYFRTFLRPNDVFWSFVEVIIMAGVVMLTHCYYGYNASGGPVGVGEAVGRSMRLSLVSVNVVVLLAEMALYGVNPNFNFTV